MKKFSTHGIEVKLYGSRITMRRAIRSIGYNCDHTEAMLVPIIAAYSFKNGQEKKLDLVGEMYLHKNISMPVLVHETLHAATTVLRKQKENMNIGNKIAYREELLAYTQTSILQDILNEFFPKNNSKYVFGDIKKWVKRGLKENGK